MDQILRCRSELMGIAILWIMFFHTTIVFPDFVGLLNFFKGIGFVGVDIFFLLSGIGLTFSLSRDSSLKRFYRKRLARIVPVYWFILIVWACRNLWLGSFNLPMFLWSLFGIDFLVFRQFSYWFIPSIALCYLAFPLYYFLSLKLGITKFFFGIVILVIAFNLLIADTSLMHLLIFTVRIPVFLLGGYIGFLMIREESAPESGGFLSNLWLNGFVLLFAAIVLNWLMNTTKMNVLWSTGLGWYPTIVMAFPLCVLMAVVLKKLSRLFPVLQSFLKWCGASSLELYLVHLSVYSFSGMLPFKDYDLNFYRLPEFLLYMVVSIVLSLLVRRHISDIDWFAIGHRAVQRRR